MNGDHLTVASAARWRWWPCGLSRQARRSKARAGRALLRWLCAVFILQSRRSARTSFVDPPRDPARRGFLPSSLLSLPVRRWTIAVAHRRHGITLSIWPSYLRYGCLISDRADLRPSSSRSTQSTRLKGARWGSGDARIRRSTTSRNIRWLMLPTLAVHSQRLCAESFTAVGKQARCRRYAAVRRLAIPYQKKWRPMPIRGLPRSRRAERPSDIPPSSAPGTG